MEVTMVRTASWLAIVRYTKKKLRVLRAALRRRIIGIFVSFSDQAHMALCEILNHMPAPLVVFAAEAGRMPLPHHPLGAFSR